jgi:hypothetical protein
MFVNWFWGVLKGIIDIGMGYINWGATTVNCYIEFAANLLFGDTKIMEMAAVISVF